MFISLTLICPVFRNIFCNFTYEYLNGVCSNHATCHLNIRQKVWYSDESVFQVRTRILNFILLSRKMSSSGSSSTRYPRWCWTWTWFSRSASTSSPCPFVEPTGLRTLTRLSSILHLQLPQTRLVSWGVILKWRHSNLTHSHLSFWSYLNATATVS